MQRVSLCLYPVVVFASSLLGCASTMAPGEARTQVEQLMTLYKDDRTKFVIQKQHLEQEPNCAHVLALRDESKKMEDEANMKPGDTMEVSQLHRELEDAAKVCKSR